MKINFLNIDSMIKYLLKFCHLENKEKFSRLSDNRCHHQENF